MHLHHRRLARASALQAQLRQALAALRERVLQDELVAAQVAGRAVADAVTAYRVRAFAVAPSCIPLSFASGHIFSHAEVWIP